jgi:hypothetical protein
MRTVGGRVDLKDHVPDQYAEAVRRLRSAGAVIMGKSNMPPGNQDVQADNAVFGPSSNPWDTTRTSGGSAGGGAVATAAGLAAFDFGSEIGGSTRIPAHFNGLYGHVYPRELEEVLMEHSAVSLVAVIGVPHESHGEEIKAVVVRKAGSGTTEEELAAWAKERLAAYKYPRIVQFVDELPLTSTGKILKRQLI